MGHGMTERQTRGRFFVALLALAFLPLLGGCGFHPLYASGDGGGTGAIFRAIYVEPIADRSGYELRNSLIDLFDAGGRTQKTYRLAITLQEDQKGVALQTDATITRYNYNVRAHYVLTDAKGAVVARGQESTLSSYNVVASPYATLIAQQDAQKQAVSDLAQRIRLDLGVFFSRQKAR